MVFRCVSSYALIQYGHTSSNTSDTTTPKAQTARMIQALRFPFLGGFGAAVCSLNAMTLCRAEPVGSREAIDHGKNRANSVGP